MKKIKTNKPSVYAASINKRVKESLSQCDPYVSCPCDVETNPCAYCSCAPRSCSCRTIAVAAMREEYDPVMLAILRSMAEGKTLDQLLEEIRTKAKRML